jgi:hypothetical protein
VARWAGFNRGQQCCLDLSMFLGHQEQTTGHWRSPIPNWKNAVSPPWHPALQYIAILRTSQDCGSSAAQAASESRCSLRRKITPHDPTICRHYPLTTSIEGVYRPGH